MWNSTDKPIARSRKARARLGDLRDVAVNYPELNKKVTRALEQYSVVPSSPVPRAN